MRSERGFGQALPGSGITDDRDRSHRHHLQRRGHVVTSETGCGSVRLPWGSLPPRSLGPAKCTQCAVKCGFGTTAWVRSELGPLRPKPSSPDDQNWDGFDHTWAPFGQISFWGRVRPDLGSVRPNVARFGPTWLARFAQIPDRFDQARGSGAMCACRSRTGLCSPMRRAELCPVFVGATPRRVVNHRPKLDSVRLTLTRLLPNMTRFGQTGCRSTICLF